MCNYALVRLFENDKRFHRFYEERYHLEKSKVANDFKNIYWFLRYTLRCLTSAIEVAFLLVPTLYIAVIVQTPDITAPAVVSMIHDSALSLYAILTAFGFGIFFTLRLNELKNERHLAAIDYAIRQMASIYSKKTMSDSDSDGDSRFKRFEPFLSDES